MIVTDVREVALGDWVQEVRDLKGDGYTYFDWLSAVDQGDALEEAGLDLYVQVLRLGDAKPVEAVRLKARLPEGSPAPSLTGVFAGAAWHERETHEMFGVDFGGFDDGSGLGMRPLLLPDGFEGTPLRKTFMLTARTSKPWPGAKEPGEGHESTKAPGRRRVQAPGVAPPEWGPREATR